MFTGQKETPFYQIMQTSLFAHFRDLGMPTFLLTDQIRMLAGKMRMPAGMMHMANDIVYEGELRDGLGTALTERPNAMDLKNYLENTYPTLKAEPDIHIYIFLQCC